MRFVFDTNVIVSALLMNHSIPAQALNHAEHHGIILYSEAVLHEINDVLSRPKLSPYITDSDITGFLARIQRSWHRVTVLQHIQACRDPKDNKFLEVAVNGKAAVILSGDKDLLNLDPFQNIRILTPKQYLNNFL